VYDKNKSKYIEQLKLIKNDMNLKKRKSISMLKGKVCAYFDKKLLKDLIRILK